MPVAARTLGLVTFVLAAVSAPATWAAPAILVDQADVLVDTAIGIRLEGFPPRQPVTVSATGRAVDATTWQSRAVFRSDESGRVDVSTTAPESGSYEGVSAMGLVWAMQRFPGEATPPPPDSVMHARRLSLRAEAPDGTHAAATVRRWIADPGVSRREARDAGAGAARGGELALLLGATFADVNAVIAYVPSGVLHGPFGPSEPGDSRPRAAWTHRGSPLPHLAQENQTSDLSAIVRRGGETVETPLHLSRLRDADAVARSTIPVERIKGPVLLISGKDDALWPSFTMAEIARRRLEQHRHPFPVVHLAYEGAGHAIYAGYPVTTQSTSFTHPVSGQRHALGGTPRGNAEAAADSWPRLLRFLAQSRGSR